MIIYKVTNLINGKVYIGQTKQTLEKRKINHIREGFNYNSKLVFHRALRKYGEDNFKWEVIDKVVTQTELNNKEIYWINHFNSFGENGYNMTIGGAIGGTSKLSLQDVLKIKELIQNRIPINDIAKEYDVDRDVITRIKSGRHFSYVGEDVSHIKYPKLTSNKLTELDVYEIKRLLKEDDLSRQEIAEMFNVTVGNITIIKSGKSWNQIGEDLSQVELKSRKEKLNEISVREIRILLKENKLTQREIAKIYGVNYRTINNIATNRQWKKVTID